MREDFNQTELWEWARSGSLGPFVLTRSGSPELTLLRMVDERLDRIYSLPFGEADFTEPLSPFGLWGWNERMAVFGDLEELGNVFLNELEASITEAYRDEFGKLVEGKFDELAASEDMDAAYVSPDLGEVSAPINRIELFLDPDAHKDFILEDLSVNPPPAVEEYAAKCLAQLRKPAAKPEKAVKKGTAAKAEEPKASAAAKAAEEALLEAISNIRPQNIRVEIKGLDGTFTIEKSVAIDDLVKHGGILTEHLADAASVVSEPLVPSSRIVAIFTPRGKEPAYVHSAK